LGQPVLARARTRCFGDHRDRAIQVVGERRPPAAQSTSARPASSCRATRA